MTYTDRDRANAAEKVRRATREPFAVRRGNWDSTTSPPTCLIHAETAVWHGNKARVAGGQWACPTCSRAKSRGQRRHWRTDHTDPFRYNLMRSFTTAKHHSKKVGREFTLTFDAVLQLWDNQQGRCAISGVEMEYLPGDGVRRRNKVTMDRIDSARGYTADNVWLVCDWVNRAKSDLTIEELHSLAHGIINYLPR